MNKCLCCGKEVSGEYTCTECAIKYGQSHVVVSQEEYQKLRYKEMLFDAMELDDDSLI